MRRGLENSLSNAQAIATGALNTAIAQGDWRLMFLQHDRLKAMSRKTGKSISRLVRECLTQALGRPKSSGTEGPWFKFIGTGKGTGEAVAEHHDDYLYGS